MWLFLCGGTTFFVWNDCTVSSVEGYLGVVSRMRSVEEQELIKILKRPLATEFTTYSDHGADFWEFLPVDKAYSYDMGLAMWERKGEGGGGGGGVSKGVG